MTASDRAPSRAGSVASVPGSRGIHSVDTVVVFAWGTEPDTRSLESIPAGSLVVAADSGAEQALALGLRVDVAVGDFDSITPAALATLERGGGRIERHSVAKDSTDLELALDAAVALGPRRILVVGGAGGRLDHLLGELLLLGAEAYAGVELDALLGRATIHVVRRQRLLTGRVGELVSLLALHGPAVGVVAEGFAYPLHGETLLPGSTRGISNVFAAREARVALETGVLLTVRPGTGPGA
jgi:thiamine pyrophosphokinase